MPPPVQPHADETSEDPGPAGARADVPSPDQRGEAGEAASTGPAARHPGPQPTPPADAQGARARPAALPPAEPALQQRAVAGLFIALLSLAGVLGLGNWSRGVYMALFALAAGAMALWLASTALARAGRARAAHPRGAIAAVVIGAVGVVMSGLMLVTFAVLGRQLSAYGNCLSGANTIATQQACYARFQHTIARELAVFRSGSRP